METALDQDTIHDRRWLTLSVLCLSLVMIVMGNTVLNVTIPTLVRELDASATELGWIVDSYALVFAGLLITAGALGDRFGRKLAFNIGLVLFGVASLASAFATNAEFLIATRAVMGVGAAFVMPATLSILTNVFTGKERGRAIAIWSGVAGAGGAIGPIGGGWLLEQFSWSAAFLVNVPVVVLALVAGYWLIPDSRDPAKPKLDPIGAMLSTVGLVLLVFGIIEGPDNGWLSLETWAAFVGSAVVLLAFVLFELRRDEPILDISLFKRARFSAASIGIMITFFSLFGTFFVLTQYLQFVRGYSPLDAGIRLLPMAVGMMIGAPTSARVVERIGTKLVVFIGLSFVTTGLVLTSTLEADSNYALLGLSLFITGLGMGWTMAPSTESIMGSLPLGKAGVGSAVNDTTRELGGALGVAVLGSLLATLYRHAVESDLAASGLPGQQEELAYDSIGGLTQVAAAVGGDQAGALLASGNAAFADAMMPVFLIAAAITAAGALFALLALPARAPEDSPDHDEPAPAPSPPFRGDAATHARDA